MAAIDLNQYEKLGEVSSERLDLITSFIATANEPGTAYTLRCVDGTWHLTQYQQRPGQDTSTGHKPTMTWPPGVRGAHAELAQALDQTANQAPDRDPDDFVWDDNAIERYRK